MDSGIMEYGINVDCLAIFMEQEHPEDILAGLSVIEWEWQEETVSTVQQILLNAAPS